MSPASIHQRQAWFTWAAWALAALLAVLGVAGAIDRLAQAHLAADAERSALGWARHVADNVPDIEAVFLGVQPSPKAQQHLSHMLGVAGLFRFKLFNPQGTLLVLSDTLGGTPPASAHKASDSERARGAASQAQNHIVLKAGDGVNRPTVFSEAYVPVRRGTQTLGVVEVYIDQTQLAQLTTRSFRQAALMAGATLAGTFCLGAVLWRWRSRRERRVHDRVRYLAEHDPLTGAVNHTHFAEALARACGQQAAAPGAAGLAVLCIDLDRFSDINETHGHGGGDELLRLAAARLQGTLRGGDQLARLAGDRFAVLQHLAADSSAVLGLAQRIVDALGQPYRLASTADRPERITVTASVGAALYGVDGHDADCLLHKAELAVLQAKAQGPGRWSFYDAARDQALQDRRAMAVELRTALAEGALKLHFQPLYGGDGVELLGYEALARWPHPTRGFVPPMSFVSVAEETGQIEALGRWVLDSACREAASWPAPLGVAVNLSPAQFRRGGAEIVAEVKHALATSGLAPHRLELEITESLLLSHTDQVLATLRELKALGVRIAMDDFGTGYSSLAHLWRFPFDKLKIDRAFTQGLGHDGKVDVIVHSIVALAHSLAIRVNAEGVETTEQREALRAHGCDELQGFLLGRPQPPEQLVHKARASLAADAIPACS